MATLNISISLKQGKEQTLWFDLKEQYPEFKDKDFFVEGLRLLKDKGETA